MPRRRTNRQNQTNQARGNQRQRGNSQNEENNGSMTRDQRPAKRMGFKVAEMLSDNENIEEVVQKVFDETAGFKILLEDNALSGDFLVLIVHILSKVSKSSFVHTKVQIYETVFLDTTYIKQLISFITSSPYHEQTEIRKNRYFWSDSDKFWYSLEEVFKDMKSIPSLASQVLPKLLESIVITLPILENQQSIHISDDIKSRFQVLLQKIKNIESDMVKKYRSRKLQAPNNDRGNEDDWIPPNDFRDIDVFPDILEVAIKQKPFLRKNKIVGAYKNIDHYLDVHFRLLREDFISPLREGICQYLQNPNEKRYDNIEVYPKVHFLARENANELECFRIRFDFNPKKNSENSDQFMFGSLVCFSNDRFLTLIFAKIIKSDPEMLKKGEIIVELHECENIVIHFNSDYTMVESKVYFEPYFHVLKALQKTTDDNFPFGKYLVQAKSNVYHPEYIRLSTRFTIDNRIINPTNWHHNYQFYGLNTSQENALRASLTREISIVQGPPGTGKTFLGLKIAHVLLTNKDSWYNKSPLLVICFTNHALDQFLEGVLKNTKRLLRIGGRSKNETLQNYNLNKVRRARSRAFYQAKRQVTICLEDMAAIDEKIDQIGNCRSVLHFDFFRVILRDTDNSWFRIASVQEMINWLSQDGNVYRIVTPMKNNLNSEQLKRYILRKHPFEMTMTERWTLYHHGQNFHLNYLMEERKRLRGLYKQKYKIYTEQKDMEEVLAMRDSLVIGMTTTSAARLRPVLQALRSPIVIVEEAAEVLETHIISALTGHCKQLILLGDHQQLRPSTADYTVETEYQMGISLFERMIKNNIQCHTLNVQHRMRPEICNLIRPSIYPDLKDARSVLDRPEILGVDKSLFFITHNKKEESSGDSSKKNLHEAKFLINLAKYLILNGYEPQNLTILSAYSGQMLQMQKEKKKYSLILEDVRISVLDNYQGEESDIILLSLVRNNKENKNGFLKIKNRVCVALSRARNGLYIMGNISQLCVDRDSIWSKINQTLEQQHAVGTSLKLRCQIHGVITEVQNDVDFNKIPDGGCTRQCGAVLSCGHACTNICHLTDRDHKNYTCTETCGKKLCGRSKKHVCKEPCHIWCGPCNYPCPWILDCGHEVTLKCHLDPNQYACEELVSTLLPCGHMATIPCHLEPEDFVCFQPCNTLPDCGHPCTQTCHHRKDPDHLKYKCLKRCERTRNGCSTNIHKCRKLCHEKCEPCQVIMMKQRTVCSHVHEVPCNANVNRLQCLVVVEKVVPECRHKIQIECHKKPKRKHCGGNCMRKLFCGHDCRNKCKEECTDKCLEKCERPRDGCSNNEHNCRKLCHEECEPCQVKMMKQRTVCSHIHEVPCNADVDGLQCSKPCSRMLPCGHNCAKKCFERCGPCLAIVEKVVPECRHKIQIECHKKPKRKHCGGNCMRKLFCGHDCRNKCKEECTDKCLEKCERPRDGCSNNEHNCRKLCHEECEPCQVKMMKQRTVCSHIHEVPCNADVDGLQCSKPCSRMLPCGHNCAKKCFERCGPCLVIVEKVVPECRHKIQIECYKEPIREHCGGDCKRKLSCGHDCQNKCRDECTDKCIAMKECFSPSLCGHLVKQIKCFERVFAYDETLLKYCTEPCQQVLQCTHKCTGTCGQCFQGRIHTRCTEKCGIPLVCNHKCPIPCTEVCKPCDKKCDYKCEHGQCTKKCGEVCVKCVEECPRSCIHQKCSRACGDICDVKPCEMPCPKKLTCGHDCVGFCNDPCPKWCRTCDRDKLLKNFFATESKDGVRFVELQDCGHIMESGGMESWLEKENDKIQMKVCPKCNASIFNTQRYGDFVKRALVDINMLKLKLDRTVKKNTILRIDLLARTNLLKLKVDELPNNTLLLVIRRFEDRVQEIELGDYRGYLALKSIMSKVQIIEHIIEIYCRYDSCHSSTIDAQINFLLRPLLRDEDEITIQEIKDVQLEMSRLKRMVEICQINKKYSKKTWKFLVFWSTPNFPEKLKDVEKVVMSKARYSETIDIKVKKQLKKLNCGVQISDYECPKITKAMGLSKGRWFICPNEHPYVVTECGGSKQEFKCLDC